MLEISYKHVVCVVNLIFFPCELQKHDIIKRRLDSHGNTIEARQDGIGATKVCFLFFFRTAYCDFFNENGNCFGMLVIMFYEILESSCSCWAEAAGI